MKGAANLCGVADWGVEPYARVVSWMKALAEARKRGEVPDLLLLGEHPPVITLGRNADRANLRLAADELARRGVELHPTDRGGDITYHGPGQLVGYPILDLTGHRRDVVWYVRSLEEVLIRAAREFGLGATRKQSPTGLPAEARSASRRTPAKVGKRPFYTGVWVGEEKLAAIGVHIARWVTSHGFAFNVTTDLTHFDFIVPCGIRDKGVTSLANLLTSRSTQRLQPLGPTGRSPWVEQKGGTLMERSKEEVVRAFGEVFNREMVYVSQHQLEARLGAQQAAAS